MDLCKIITSTVHNYPQNSSQLPNYPELPNKPNYPQFYQILRSKLLVIPRTTHFVQGITQNNYSYLYSKFYFGETIPVLLSLSVDVKPGGGVKTVLRKAL